MTLCNPDRSRLVYDVFDEIANRELGDEMRDLEITDAVVEEIVAEVRPEYSGANHARKSVRSLLGNTRNSPHVDWIAVDRAAEFDWGAFEALTRAERAALGKRLAAMENWSDLRPRDGLHRTQAGASSVTRPTARRMAYERGTQQQRDRLMRLVEEARNAQALAAA